MNDLFKKGIQRFSDADPRCLCLFLAGALQCLMIVLRPYAIYVSCNFALVPCVLFLALLWKHPLSPGAKKLLLLGAVLALWYAVVQSYHLYISGQSREPGPFLAVVLLALPFAAVSDDGTRRRGLTIAGGFCLLGALILALFTGLLAIGGMPHPLDSLVYWDGARLVAMWHPNITANIFLTAMGFCFYFAAMTPRRSRKALFLALSAMFFLLLCLTNSRTGAICACLLVAGAVFCLIWKGGLPRFLLGAVAGLAALALLFTLYQAVFSLHEDRMIQSYLQEQTASGTTPDLIVDDQSGQVGLHTEASQNSIRDDLGTLNSRTSIWRTALQSIRQDPQILVRGTPDIGALLKIQHSWNPTHTHNSWLEILMGLGLPGLLGAMIFTALALWHGLRILFFGGHSLPRKIIAVLVLCLLVSGVPENYLFLGPRDYQWANFLFFLCLGYLIRWQKAE